MQVTNYFEREAEKVREREREREGEEKRDTSFIKSCLVIIKKVVFRFCFVCLFDFSAKTIEQMYLCDLVA